MPDQTLCYGRAVPVEARFVALDWRARVVPSDERGHINLDELVAGVEGKGVYCFQGRHDAHREGTVLYIGQGARDCQTPLRNRMQESFGRFQERGRLYSDVHDLVVRWAPIEDEGLIDSIESLLIVAHAPPFNAAEVRRWYKGPRNLVVLNAGAKGRLSPAVVAWYHSAEGWPEEQTRTSNGGGAA